MPPKKQKVFIATTGCAVIRHDTQVYSKFFSRNDWTVTNDLKEADVILITTIDSHENAKRFS